MKLFVQISILRSVHVAKNKIFYNFFFSKFWKKYRILFTILLLINLWLSVFYLHQVSVTLPKLDQDFELIHSFNKDQSDDDEINKFAVSITGAVNNPGVYWFEQDAIIQELITEAEGLSKDADLLYVAQNINLAEILKAGQQLYIPSESERNFISDSTAKPDKDNSFQSTKLNVNNASMAELESLPGIGPATASQIVANRPYNSLEDLLDVSGIGQATLDKFKDLVEV